MSFPVAEIPINYEDEKYGDGKSIVEVPSNCGEEDLDSNMDVVEESPSQGQRLE